MEEISNAELLHRLQQLEEMTHCALGLAIAIFVAAFCGCIAYISFTAGKDSKGGKK